MQQPNPVQKSSVASSVTTAVPGGTLTSNVSSNLSSSIGIISLPPYQLRLSPVKSPPPSSPVIQVWQREREQQEAAMRLSEWLDCAGTMGLAHLLAGLVLMVVDVATNAVSGHG